MSPAAGTVSDVAFFATLLKAGTLSAAAQELGVSTAAVSRRLSALESRLGIRLLNRTTRSASLTPEGALYLEEGSRILADLEDLEQRLASSRSAPKGLLRVNAGFGFGRHYIAPMVADFVAAYPDVEVQLELTDRPLSLHEDKVDVCIRFGEVPDARVTARKLASNRRLLVASPAYLARRGMPQTPAELRQHQCIFIRERDEVYGTWRLQQGSTQQTIKVGGPVSTNDGEAALDWALKGLGILMRSQWHVAPHLQSGALVEVLAEWASPPADIHVVYPMKKNLSAKIQVFVDFMVQAMASRHHKSPMETSKSNK